jgi:hypothetical protein
MFLLRFVVCHKKVDERKEIQEDMVAVMVIDHPQRQYPFSLYDKILVIDKVIKSNRLNQ